ncbi:MAG: hypothetical protein NVSMB45_17820 [Ginsengibacter sp.]
MVIFEPIMLKSNEVTMEIYQKEVLKRLDSEKGSTPDFKILFLQNYIGTRLKVIGITVPNQRKIFKEGYSFNTLSPVDQLEIWDEVWSTGESYELLSQCIYFVEYNLKKIDTRILWNITRDWVKKVDNWAHSDGLSNIYSFLLEKHPEIIYPQYIKWNKSKNSWERRQSLVGLLYMSGKRKKYLKAEELLVMPLNLLNDENYSVQKGLGWTLREIGKIYPKETFSFLLEHVKKISPVAFSTAIEKLTVKEKGILKKIRKEKKTVGDVIKK